MAQAPVVFNGVWKKFRRGERHDSLRDLIPSMARRMLGRTRSAELEQEEFWAIKDVSFEVQPGEALGIIGPNGSGKSTTLKLLTRILRPTRGNCAIRGRIGALIEIAAGFHPDLTGRENVFLQGAIMGMRRSEITAKLDSIVDFAGVDDFIDTPVKRYSSGMNARLGFSIAAHLEPDVLVVDEVLSVGDMAFQERCIARMLEFKRNGTPIVFVSHNLQAVAQLCQRTIVLGKGELLFDGATEPAVEIYVKASQTKSGRYGLQNQSFELLRADIEWDRVATGDQIPPHSIGTLSVSLKCVADSSGFNIGMELERTRDLLYCYGVTSEQLGYPLHSCAKGDSIDIRFTFRAHLTRGHYRININVHQPGAGAFLFAAESVGQFSISEQRSYDGLVDIDPQVQITFPYVTSSNDERAVRTA
jgi:lipopolysaccharide transport system ATP-binding protein